MEWASKVVGTFWHQAYSYNFILTLIGGLRVLTRFSNFIFYVANSNDFIAKYIRDEKKHFDLHSGRARTRFNKIFYLTLLLIKE